SRRASRPSGPKTSAARSCGGEVAVSVHAGPLRLSTTYTALFTRDRTDQAASAGAPLPGRPAHDLVVDLSFQKGPWTVRWGFDLVSETTLDRAGLRTLPTRAFHSIGGRVALPGGFTLAAEIANLFDQRTVVVPFELGQPERRYPISDFQGYPIPGRRGLVSLRWSH
ncbi:MAG: TonB-dependent receptor, partial [Myxococcales bacterium]|nr:TonB-dependent receptor [Myxococcales bacterium]